MVCLMIRIKAWQSAVAPFVVNDTDEDLFIIDIPASWSYHREYRLVEKQHQQLLQSQGRHDREYAVAYARGVAVGGFTGRK